MRRNVRTVDANGRTDQTNRTQSIARFDLHVGEDALFGQFANYFGPILETTGHDIQSTALFGTNMRFYRSNIFFLFFLNEKQILIFRQFSANHEIHSTMGHHMFAANHTILCCVALQRKAVRRPNITNEMDEFVSGVAGVRSVANTADNVSSDVDCN